MKSLKKINLEMATIYPRSLTFGDKTNKSTCSPKKNKIKNKKLGFICENANTEILIPKKINIPPKFCVC